MKLLASLLLFFSVAAQAGSLKSEELGNGVGYSGQGPSGCWRPGYQIDPEYSCPKGGKPGYRAALLPKDEDGACYLKDACTGALKEIDRWEVVNSDGYLVAGVDYDEELMSFGNAIFDIDAGKRDRAEAWCEGGAHPLGIMKLEVVVRTNAGQPTATIVYKGRIPAPEPSPSEPEEWMPYFSVRKVMPFSVHRSEANQVRSYHGPEMELRIPLEPGNLIEGSFRAVIDGRVIESSHLYCSWSF